MTRNELKETAIGFTTVEESSSENKMTDSTSCNKSNNRYRPSSSKFELLTLQTLFLERSTSICLSAIRKRISTRAFSCVVTCNEIS